MRNIHPGADAAVVPRTRRKEARTAEERAPWPPWCGRCDERTRLLLLSGDDPRPARCRCHPLYSEPLFQPWDLPQQVGSWCGVCDERTRLVDPTGTGQTLVRCSCHPLYGRPTDTDVRPVPAPDPDGQSARRPDAPAWCGLCDPRTRLTDPTGDGLAPARCSCHPLHGQPSDTDVRPAPEAGQSEQDAPRPTPPPWCGSCDKQTRLTDPTGDGQTLARCSSCHPLRTEPLTEPQLQPVSTVSDQAAAAYANHVRTVMRRHWAQGWMPQRQDDGA